MAEDSLQAGDSIVASVLYKDVDKPFHDDVNITFVIDDRRFLTCGHCMNGFVERDKNGIKDYCTTGFETSTEWEERSVVEVVGIPLSKKLFGKKLQLRSDKVVGDNVFLVRNRKMFNGSVLMTVHEDLPFRSKQDFTVWYSGKKFIVEFTHTVNKLEPPYHLVLPSFEYAEFDDDGKGVVRVTRQGYSGCPWVFSNGDGFCLLGSHVASTCAHVYGDGKNALLFEAYVCYVKDVSSVQLRCK
jgi:hypothetical protein